MNEEQLKALATEIETLRNQAKTLRAEITAKGDAATSEEKNKLGAMLDDGIAKQEAYTEARRIFDQGKARDSFLGAANGTNTVKAQEQLSPALKSWGQIAHDVVDNDDYRLKRRDDLPRTKVGGFLGMIGAGRKAIYNTTDTAGGYAVTADRQADILDIARQRPRSVIDLVNHSTTNSDLVEYVIMDTRDNQAAIVSEYTAGNFGLKPESNLTLDLKTAAVNTIATWIAASRQILSDAPRLRQMIDNELTYMVEVALENKLVTDILAWSGIQTRTHASTGSRGGLTTDTIAETLRRAITDLYLEFYRPDGIVLHPADGEKLELLRETSPGVGAFLGIYDSATMRVWRVPVVETPAMTSGTALVGNFRLGVTVWDREETQVLTGQPNDFFLRNAWAILAELREAHAVTRPKAIEKITSIV
jgi:HK97 family phage major capsid protein